MKKKPKLFVKKKIVFELTSLFVLFADPLDGSQNKSTEKKHPCTNCGKKFASFKSLLMHYNIHRGLTKCNICNAVLSRTGNLKRHIRLKHSNIDQSSKSEHMKIEKE